MKSQSTDTPIAEKKQNGTTRIKTLEELFANELKGIYDAEKQLAEAFPVLVNAAYNEDLQDAFEFHLQQTKRHVERLEKIFVRLRMNKEDEKKCIVMRGLIEECKKTVNEFEASPVRDSALIIAVQKIEHFEIASYGSLCELADVLGYSKIAELLDRTLEEEETTDKNLTVIAQDINDEAFESEHEKVY